MAHCLRVSAERYQTEPPQLTPTQMAKWMAHPWPGNVRELKIVADRLCLGLELDARVPGDSAPQNTSLHQQVDGFERQLLVHALTHCQGSVASAAEHLQVPRKTLYDKLTRHAIDPADFR
jgi:two-component system C4-dicarboxylate transport response regulator DctD